MKFRLIYQSGKILAISALFFTTACKKDISQPLKPDNESAASTLSDSSTAADNAYNDVFINAFYSSADNQLNGLTHALNGRTSTNSTTEVNRLAWSCATYTVDTTLVTRFPITVTVDFGADGCTSNIDGLIRKGKIIYVFSGHLLTPGTTISAAFDHYFVNGYGLQGTCSITNNSTQNGFSFTTQITNGIFTFPDLTNFHYTGNKIIQMPVQISPPYFTDVSITGNSNFSASDGSSLVSTISTPLVKKIDCRYISSGVISFVYNQGVTGTIDFGNGTCDSSATLNVGSVTKEITLR